MRSLLMTAVTGLVGAALLHIVIIFALPWLSTDDAWARIVGLGAAEQFYPLANEPNVAGLYNENPLLRSAVCRFDVSAAPVRVTADGEAVPFWSVSVFDRGGNEVYSMNDRTAVLRRVDLLLAQPAQIMIIRRAAPETLQDSVPVEVEAPAGYVILRTLIPDSSFEPIARGFLSEAACQPQRPAVTAKPGSADDG